MKKVLLRRIHLLFALLLSAGLLAGCIASPAVDPGQNASGQDGKEKPKIRIAYSWNAGTGFEKAFSDQLKQFGEDNAELAEYTFEGERGDSLRDKIKIDQAANSLPDIFYYWSLTSLKTMYEEGLILDVNKYFDASNSVKADKFVRYALDAYSPDGKSVYAVPATGSMDYFACNRELFEKYGLKYPKTYEELLAVSKVFRDNGVTPLAVGSKGGNPAHFLFAEVYYQFGSLEYMNKVTTGKNRFDYDLNRKTADIVLDMARNGLFPEDTVASGYFAPSVSLFNEEKAAMILGQTWSIQYFKDEIIPKIDLITFPKFPDAVNDPSSFCVGGVNNGWVINRASFEDPKEGKAVVAAMDFLVSDRIMSLIAENGEFIMKKMEVDPSKLSPLYKKVVQFTQAQKPLTNFWILMPDPTSQEVLSVSMDELWAQTIDSATFCRKIQSSIDNAVQNELP